MSAVQTSHRPRPEGRPAPPRCGTRSAGVTATNPSVAADASPRSLIFVGMLIYGEVAYGRIVQASTLSNLLINNAHLIILAVGHDVRDPHRRHRPLGRLGHRAVRPSRA